MKPGGKSQGIKAELVTRRWRTVPGSRCSQCNGGLEGSAFEAGEKRFCASACVSAGVAVFGQLEVH